MVNLPFYFAFENITVNITCITCYPIGGAFSRGNLMQQKSLPLEWQVYHTIRTIMLKVYVLIKPV